LKADFKKGMHAISAGTARTKPITGKIVNPKTRNKIPMINKMTPIMKADNFSPKQSKAFIVAPPLF
jgi:hypothetical protein